MSSPKRRIETDVSTLPRSVPFSIFCICLGSSDRIADKCPTFVRRPSGHEVSIIIVRTGFRTRIMLTGVEGCKKPHD